MIIPVRDGLSERRFQPDYPGLSRTEKTVATLARFCELAPPSIRRPICSPPIFETRFVNG